MTTVKKKAGRKTKPFYAEWLDKTIDGLLHETDGRWKIVAIGKRFSETDERLAVAKFFELSGAAPVANAILLEKTNPKKYGKEVAAHVTELPSNIVMVDEAQFWARVRREILMRARWVAEQVGIEEIGYLANLKKPETLPTFEEIERVWMDHADCSIAQRKKVKRAWADFLESTEIKSIHEITPQLAIAYQDDVHSRNISGKQQLHFFAGTRRMLSFAKRRAIAVDAMTRAIDYLKLMQPNESTGSIDPHPITVEDWRTLLSHAKGDTKAMILLMLNCALYAGEVIRVKWCEIKNGCYVSRRAKKGEHIRVASLWPETLDAIKQIEKKGEYLFNTYRGLPIKVCGAFRRFADLTEKAKITHVKPSHLRDGTYSEAVAANVSFPLCQLLAGHATGMSDNYVLGSPKMVKPATDAVYNAYFTEASATMKIAGYR